MAVDNDRDPDGDYTPAGGVVVESAYATWLVFENVAYEMPDLSDLDVQGVEGSYEGHIIEDPHDDGAGDAVLYDAEQPTAWMQSDTHSTLEDAR